MADTEWQHFGLFKQLPNKINSVNKDWSMAKLFSSDVKAWVRTSRLSNQSQPGMYQICTTRFP